MKHPPIKIEIMLRCYYTTDLYHHVISSLSSAHAAFLLELIRENLIEEFGTGRIAPTARGNAWVSMLRETPYPRLKECWVDPRTNEELEGSV